MPLKVWNPESGDAKVCRRKDEAERSRVKAAPSRGQTQHCDARADDVDDKSRSASVLVRVALLLIVESDLAEAKELGSSLSGKMREY